MPAAIASSVSPSATMRGAEAGDQRAREEARPVHRHDVPLNAEIGIADGEAAHLHGERRRGHHQIHHGVSDDAAQGGGDEARLPRDLKQRPPAMQIGRRRLRRIDVRPASDGPGGSTPTIEIGDDVRPLGQRDALDRRRLRQRPALLDPAVHGLRQCDARPARSPPPATAPPATQPGKSGNHARQRIARTRAGSACAAASRSTLPRARASSAISSVAVRSVIGILPVQARPGCGDACTMERGNRAINRRKRARAMQTGTLDRPPTIA